MIDKQQALEIIDKRDFFNDRAGRELWNDKPKEIQDEDIRNAHEEYEQLKEYVLNQPKVGKWIPVEERLPNEEEFEKNYCRNHWGAEFIVMIKGANRPTSLYYKEGVWFDDDNNDYDVIAWQPLPEPFKGD